MRIRCVATVLSLLVHLPLAPLEAGAGKPAVKELNGRVVADYGFEHIGGSAQLAAGSLRVQPATDQNSWAFGGVLTAPLMEWLGARAFVAGGRSRLESAAVLGLPGSNTNSGGVVGGAQVFVRNPEFGYFGLGYGVRWENFTVSPIDTTLTHELQLDAGFFIPDQGLGPIDWNFVFRYGHATVDAFGPEESVDEFTLDWTVGWYFGRSFRLVGGIHWLREQPTLVQPRDDLRGLFAGDWLLPFFGERRYVTATFYGSAGRIDQALPSPFSSVRRSVYSVGGRLTFSYPGATSLLELTREYH